MTPHALPKGAGKRHVHRLSDNRAVRQCRVFCEPAIFLRPGSTAAFQEHFVSTLAIFQTAQERTDSLQQHSMRTPNVFQQYSGRPVNASVDSIRILIIFQQHSGSTQMQSSSTFVGICGNESIIFQKTFQDDPENIPEHSKAFASFQDVIAYVRQRSSIGHVPAVLLPSLLLGGVPSR
jgi:hypothetical protein